MDISNLSADTAQRLKLLIERIDSANIPPSQLDETLNIATWNIRDFGKATRTEDGIVFVAQILFQFDLIAITELRDDLNDFKRVLSYLGPHWKFVVSDWQDDWGGNWERTAFLYDERMVSFTGLAAEAQPDRKKVNAQYLSEQSWWRAPYMASFKAGNFDFIMLAMHARWGKTAKGRQDELRTLGDWIGERWGDDADSVFDQDLIVVGDFNIPRVDDDYYKALTANSKLQMPKALEAVNDTAVSSGNRRYDQILHRTKNVISYADHGGIVDFASGGLLKKLFEGTGVRDDKLTYELSDHFPLWIQLKTDDELYQLDSIIANR